MINWLLNMIEPFVSKGTAARALGGDGVAIAYSSYQTSMYGGSVYFNDSGEAIIDGKQYMLASEVEEVKQLRKAAEIEKANVEDRQILV